MIKTIYLIENTKINGKTLKLNTLKYGKLGITFIPIKIEWYFTSANLCNKTSKGINPHKYNRVRD